MAKNTKKKAKFKPVTIEIPKHKYKKLMENIFKFMGKYNNVLTGINFKVKGDILTLAATDGMTLLKSEIALDETAANECELTLNGFYLWRIKLNVSYEFGRKKKYRPIDTMLITFNEDSALFEDKLNGIKYNIPTIKDTTLYPDYEKLIPNTKENKNYIQVGLNTSYIARLADISDSRTRMAILNINTKDQNSAVVVHSTDRENNIKNTSLLMPIQLRE